MQMMTYLLKIETNCKNKVRKKCSYNICRKIKEYFTIIIPQGLVISEATASIN